MLSLNNEMILTKLTKKSMSQQRALVKLFMQLSVNEQLEVISEKNLIFHKIRSKDRKFADNSIYALAAFYMAINEFINKLNSVEVKVISFRRKKINNSKSDKLLSYWSIVKQLKNKNKMSFRDISKYLEKYYKFNISYSLIYINWLRIEKDKEI